MTELTLEVFRVELGPIRAELETINIRVAGLPLLSNAIAILQRDSRLIRAAINDMGKTNITSGEVEAMHEDIDRTLARQDELEARLANIERLLTEQILR